jgi:hypothetical protein
VTHIRLGMIVKDAEQKLPTLAASVKPLIESWFIIDTGSTDRTREVALELFHDLPGQLAHSVWKGHAHNRTELLQRSRNPPDLPAADYLLMLDDDMELIVDQPLPPLVLDEYLIPIHDRKLVYPLPLLTSMRREWEYKGAAHAYLCTADGGPPPTTETISWMHIVEHNAGTREGKIEADRDALLQATKDEPENARNWFYLAQSYRDLDQTMDAIACYRMAASLTRWDEEKYYALYQAGSLLVSQVAFYEGAPLLLEAWRMRPHRTEALRVLSASAAAVADKIPFPKDDVLFVEEPAYKSAATGTGVEPHREPQGETREVTMQFGNVMANDRPAPRFKRNGKLDPESVAAIIVTRGDHPDEVREIVDGLPYGQIMVWDNSKAQIDLGVFGRYAAIPLTDRPVVYWQDDDVVFTEHEALLAEYEPGKLVSNMDAAWIDGAGYRDRCALVGAGSLCDADLPGKIWTRYFEHFPFEPQLLRVADFAFGTLVPFKIVDLGYGVYPYTDDADRLYKQPGQTEAKHAMIDRCRRILLGPDTVEQPTGQRLWVPPGAVTA